LQKASAIPKKSTRLMIFDSHYITNQQEFCFEGFLFGMPYEKAVQYVRKGIEDSGIAFIKDLNGSFCGYYSSKEKGEVFIFNDRLGMKDLFLFEANNRVVVGNDFMELVNIVGAEDIDVMAFGEMLRMQAPLFRNTFHQNIKLCSGATLLQISIESANIVKEERYWRLCANPNDLDEKTLLETFDSIAHKAVNECFNEADKTYYIPNSGGLDSRCNLWLASQNQQVFSTYTYGDNNSDAYDIAKQTSRALNLKQKFFPVDEDFLNKYAQLLSEKSPMLPINYCWYYTAYQYLNKGGVNITGFGNFFEAFTHLDTAGLYRQLNLNNKDEICKYNYNIHSVCSDDVYAKLLRKQQAFAHYEAYRENMNNLVNDKAYDMFDEFEFEHRQRRITKNEPWMEYFGNLQGRHPMIHNEMVDFSLKLTFGHRDNKQFLKNYVRDYMTSVADIRLERLPWGPKEPQGIERKLKHFIWRLDNKLYRETGKRVVYKGSHKNIKQWLLNKDNYQFIVNTLNTPNELFEEYFQTSFINNNLNKLIETNYLTLGSIITIKMYLDKIMK
jgi:hypothetical protein